LFHFYRDITAIWHNGTTKTMSIKVLVFGTALLLNRTWREHVTITIRQTFEGKSQYMLEHGCRRHGERHRTIIL